MIIIIPGACGRIGQAISYHLFKKGHKLILGDANKIQLNKLKKLINKDRVIFYQGDLSKQINIKKFINFELNTLKKLMLLLIVCTQKVKTGIKKLVK